MIKRTLPQGDFLWKKTDSVYFEEVDHLLRERRALLHSPEPVPGETPGAEAVVLKRSHRLGNLPALRATPLISPEASSWGKPVSQLQLWSWRPQGLGPPRKLSSLPGFRGWDGSCRAVFTNHLSGIDS